MNEENQEIFKVEEEKVSSVGKMDMSGAFGATSINVEKVKGAENFGKTVKRLIKYMRPELIALILMILISGIGAWFAVWVPDILKKVTNYMADHIQYFKTDSMDMGYVAKICWIAASLYCLNAVFAFTGGVIAARMAQSVVRRMRYDIKVKLDFFRFFNFDTRFYLFCKTCNL